MQHKAIISNELLPEPFQGYLWPDWGIMNKKLEMIFFLKKADGFLTSLQMNLVN